MIDIKRINQEYDSIARDLAAARESELLRIIRNKRNPIAQRYAAMLHHEQLLSPDAISMMPDNSSDEKLMKEINQFLWEIDRNPL